jgi:hypothetical protein
MELMEIMMWEDRWEWHLGKCGIIITGLEFREMWFLGECFEEVKCVAGLKSEQEL